MKSAATSAIIKHVVPPIAIPAVWDLDRGAGLSLLSSSSSSPFSSWFCPPPPAAPVEDEEGGVLRVPVENVVAPDTRVDEPEGFAVLPVELAVLDPVVALLTTFEVSKVSTCVGVAVELMAVGPAVKTYSVFDVAMFDVAMIEPLTRPELSTTLPGEVVGTPVAVRLANDSLTGIPVRLVAKPDDSDVPAVGPPVVGDAV
jgi:hypothetical protein